MIVDYSHYESPLGIITLAVCKQGLCALEFDIPWERFHTALTRGLGATTFRQGRLADLEAALDGYFARRFDALEGIPAAPTGSPFQQRVWAELRRIPVGQTISYRQLAESVGCRGGARAVGAANASNPVAIVIPCHRVIRADGSLCGYAAGVERKEWLLRHEGVCLDLWSAAGMDRPFASAAVSV